MTNIPVMAPTTYKTMLMGSPIELSLTDIVSVQLVPVCPLLHVQTPSPSQDPSILSKSQSQAKKIKEVVIGKTLINLH